MCNFDVVWEFLGEVFVRVSLCSLVDLQNVAGVKIGVGLLDNVQKRSHGVDVSRNRCDFKLFRLLNRRLPVG